MVCSFEVNDHISWYSPNINLHVSFSYLCFGVWLCNVNARQRGYHEYNGGSGAPGIHNPIPEPKVFSRRYVGLSGIELGS